MKSEYRKGSALLVVLGMISFMVISAVAFSAFMRYSRLPSSYLRRSSASRHLAHAALAEAIDVLDVSIGDNPHPGFGTRAYEYPRENGETLQRNFWRDRCFIGTNQLVSAEETVSTLALEGLAYIPPALVNEARYYSRHADSARWHDLGYDSGRFAFFALDVSDCFDVNRVPANWARTSADLGKVSLAYAFENADHSAYTVKPSAWDAFMENYVDFDKLMDGLPPSSSKMPIVSLADLNLAAYAKGKDLVQYVSPFCNYVMNGTEFVTSETGPEAEVMRSLNVVADGLYPPVQVNASEADIMRAADQPFTTIDTGDAQPGDREVLRRIRTTGIGKVLSDELPPIDLVNLYDYLDENDIPTSLALPTTERVPMICGLQGALKLRLEPKVETQDEPNREALGDKEEFVETTTCTLRINGTGALSALYMFPFRRDRDIPSQNYTGEFALRICLGVGTPGLRTKAASRYVVKTRDDFTAKGVVDSAMMPEAQKTTLSFPNVDVPEDALKLENAVTLNFGDVQGWFESHPLLTIKKTYVVHVDTSSGIPVRTYEEQQDKRTGTVNPDFQPVSADGCDRDVFTADMLKGGGAVTVRPYMTLAARVRNANDKTVDLVPANVLDDLKYNGVESDKFVCNVAGADNDQPLVLLSGDKEFAFGEEFFQKGEPVEVMIQPSDPSEPSSQGGSLVCPDPRWNYAPENFVRQSGNLDKGQFLSSCGVGQDGRDGDIFMFVSNQGYLQSVSELAFLPRTALPDDDFGAGDQQVGACAVDFKRNRYATSIDDAPNGKLMWRTYRLWNQNGRRHDDLYDILGVFDGGRGARVNPYTDSQQAFMAALANTPYSWWAASTNYNARVHKSNVEGVSDNAEQFNRKYAFCAMNNDGAQLDWNDLKLVAENLQRAMRENENGDWIGCEASGGWENIDWGGEGKTGDARLGWLAGVELQGNTDDLYDVDRKFLYGYWRECFAAKQQLFLVFVRAEPLMMGGGRIGQTPPQLGVRAVALVWRNPSPGSVGGIVASGDKDILKKYAPQSAKSQIDKVEPGFPHRTRVLFYRQFD